MRYNTLERVEESLFHQTSPSPLNLNRGQNLKAFINRWVLTFMSIVTLQLSLSEATQATEVDEFNEDSDGWSTYPSVIGRSSEPGWVVVSNDGERAIRNSPTTTRSTYYWKLTKDFDLTHISQPSLDFKYHFKGRQYQYVRVQVGDENAQKLSDFGVIYEQSTATAEPEEVMIDLSAYSGKIIKVQILLRKPYDVAERRIGLYIHRVGLSIPPEPAQLEETFGDLRVAAFNVQVFGLSKMGHSDVVATLTEIITRFDLIFIQEVRDISETAVFDLLEELNLVSPAPFSLIQSERLGRTSSKEQYVIFYRSDKLQNLHNEVAADPNDVFERPPYFAQFEHLESELRFSVIGVHLTPDDVVSEIREMYTFFDSKRIIREEGEGFIVMGDLSADCGHLNREEQEEATLLNNIHLVQQISHDKDTTTTATHCAYDRLMITHDIDGMKQDSGVFYFDQELMLTGELTRAVSDHYPVWIRFNPARGVQGGMEGGEMVGGEMVGGEMVGGEMTGGEMAGGEGG